jgi:DNA-binding TFAR19-related protein (PDSD5 family)
MTVSIERMEKALVYLAESDDLAATLKADTERAEYKARAIRDAVFRRLSDGGVADRQALAGSSEEYAAAMEAYFIALARSEHIRNKRNTESIVIEVWRSINSSRNKGNL